MSLTSDWQDALGVYLERAEGPEGIAAALDGWASDAVGTDSRFVAWHYERSLQASLAGQLMVRAVEMGQVDLGAEDERAAALLYALARNDETAFLGLPFEDAVEFFRDKEIMSPGEFDALRDRFRAGGFTARAIASEALRERARMAINRALEDGNTITQIIQEIRSDSLTLGVSPANTSALQLIARNGVATAYGHGRWTAMQDPVVRQLRPFVQQVAITDHRTRPTHLRLHGLVFEAGGELAALYAPPLGHNCRCGQRSLSQRQLDAMGLAVTTMRVVGGGPDEGWEDPPMPLAA